MDRNDQDAGSADECPECGAALRILVEPGLHGPVRLYVCALHGLISADS
ncbi:hypothetical protein [Planctomonas psychrotolerans]|nr:hypothetical protein [Planctomonas psychrotolerans]